MGQGLHFIFPQASLVAQLGKNLPAVWETWVRSLGWEDPLVQGMATHGQRSLVGYSAWGRKEPDTTEKLTLYYYFTNRVNSHIWSLKISKHKAILV